jgi:hypothetical protein
MHPNGELMRELVKGVARYNVVVEGDALSIEL